MKNYEEELGTLFEEMKKQTSFKIDSWDKIISALGKVYTKISQQRTELIKSRNEWRNKYYKLKGGK